MSTKQPPAPTRNSPNQGNSISGIFRRTWNYLDKQAGLDYLMIRIIVMVLIGLGVVMVFSSSMTWSILEGASVWNTALRQSFMVILGLAAFWVALKLPMVWIRRGSFLLMLLAAALLIAVLVVGTGREEVGSQSWLMIGSVSFQPSELAKVAIALWGASHLAANNTEAPQASLRSPFVQYIIAAGVFFFLIIAQGDYGMALSFAAVVGFTLLFAGIHWSFIIAALVAGFLGLLVIFLSGTFRSDRFHTYFDALFGNFEDTQQTAFQSYQGFLSLADGSLFGVGLGQSRAKWFYLPEAKNDFIFAIIGEELGLWGGALVIALFGLLGFFGLRTALRAQNRFQSLAAAALTMSVVSQAFINIGYVVGLLPVTGIQLPMISAGGTSAVITIGSMGILASIARHEPDSVSAMRSYGRPMFDRLLFIGEPATEKEEITYLKDRRQERDGRRNAPQTTPVTSRAHSQRPSSPSRYRVTEPASPTRASRSARDAHAQRTTHSRSSYASGAGDTGRTRANQQTPRRGGTRPERRYNSTR